MTIYYIGKSGIPVIKKAHVSEIEWHRGIIRLYNLKGVFVCQINNIGEKVTIKGWVSKVRNLGGLVFIDLRNRSGIIQVVVRPENKYYNIANDLKSEYVIKIIGTIVERESKNPKLETGDIEVNAEILELITTSKEIPFTITNLKGINS